MDPKQRFKELTKKEQDIILDMVESFGIHDIRILKDGDADALSGFGWRHGVGTASNSCKGINYPISYLAGCALELSFLFGKEDTCTFVRLLITECRFAD